MQPLGPYGKALNFQQVTRCQITQQRQQAHKIPRTTRQAAVSEDLVKLDVLQVHIAL